MSASPGNVRLRRAYDAPTPADGQRVLVDRIWPRGRTREQLRLDDWARDLGPSTELRRWFGHDPARWAEFQRRYRAELVNPDRAHALDALVERARLGPLTLVFGARDPDRNQAVVIAAEIERRVGRAPGARLPHPSPARTDRIGRLVSPTTVVEPDRSGPRSAASAPRPSVGVRSPARARGDRSG